jgi:hypothetical protein
MTKSAWNESMIARANHMYIVQLPSELLLLICQLADVASFWSLSITCGLLNGIGQHRVMCAPQSDAYHGTTWKGWRWRAYDVQEACARYGYLDLLKLSLVSGMPSHAAVLRSAVTHNQLDILEYMKQLVPISAWTRGLYTTAMIHGNLPMLQWLYAAGVETGCISNGADHYFCRNCIYAGLPKNVPINREDIAAWLSLISIQRENEILRRRLAQ